MNIPVEWAPCLRTLGLLTFEILLAIAAAAWATTRVRSALWQRVIWQTVTVAVALLGVLEVGGWSGELRTWGRGHWERQLLSRGGGRADVGPADHGPGVAQLRPEFRQKVVQRLAANRSELMALPNSQSRMIPAAMVDDSSEVEPFFQDHATPWPEVIWGIGTGTALGVILLARLCFWLVLLHHRRPVADERLLERIASLAPRLGIRSHVHVFESRHLKGPVAFGVLRMSIGLPVEFARRFTLPQQAVILAHELAHLAGRDPFWQGLADGVAAMLWWHPMVWWARHRLRAAAEGAADEASLLVAGGPGILAECLLQLAAAVAGRQPLGSLGATGPGFRSGLGRRVERLVSLGGSWSPPRSAHSRTVKLVVPLVLVAGTVLCTAWAGPNQSNGGMQSMTRTWKRSMATLALLTGLESHQPEIAAPPSSTPASTPSALGTEMSEFAPGPTENSVQDARTLIELGRFDEAKAKLQMFLRYYPEDRTASNYLRLAQQSVPTAAKEVTLDPASSAAKKETNGTAPDPSRARYGSGSRYRAASRYGLQPQGQVAANQPAVTPTDAEKEASDAAEDPAAQPPPDTVENTPQMDPRLMERYGLKPPAPRPPTPRASLRQSHGKQQVEAKLNQIVLNEILYDGLPLSEAVRDLKDLSRRKDPAGQGINFLISNLVDARAAGAEVDPTTGAPIASMQSSPVALGDVSVRLHLGNVRLKDVLDAMVRVTDPLIRYSVEDYGVVFSPAGLPSATAPPPQPAPLRVRTFHVDTNSFVAGLESAFGIYLSEKVEPAEIQALEKKLQGAKEALARQQAELARRDPHQHNPEALEQQVRRLNHEFLEASQGRPDRARKIQSAVQQLLLQLGIDVDVPNKAVFYNDLTGILMVRATAEDLELVQAAIETLGGKPHSQGASAGFSTPAPSMAKSNRESGIEPQGSGRGNEQRSSAVSIIGKVNHEGAVELVGDQKIDLLEGIARAGGFSPIANKNKIELSRNGDVTTYRFDDLKRAKDSQQKIWLEPGDVVYVHEALF